MSQVGQRERLTQNRIVQLFQQQLHYHYLGNWSDRANNSNIETEILTTFLRDKQGYSDRLITKALYELNKVAGDQSKGLYDINKEVYNLLRYGGKVKAEAGENTQTASPLVSSNLNAALSPFPKVSAKTLTTKNLFLSNPSSPPCNLSWRVTTPKDSATPLQKPQKNITLPGKKIVTAISPIP